MANVNIAKVIDWVGVRLMLLGLLGIPAFAVVQPLVWEWAFDKSAPVAVANLGTLLTVLVTLVSLALAGFGIMAYALVTGKLEESLTERISEIQREVEESLTERTSGIQKEVEKRTLALTEYTLIKLQLFASYQSYQSYDEMWQKEEYDHKVTESQEFTQLVERALDEAEDALQRTKTLPNTEEFVGAFTASKNTVAYHLGTRQLPSDKQRAIELANELAPLKEEKPHVGETIAWVYLRFSGRGDPEYVEAVQIAKRLFEDERIPQSWRTRLREKYARLFSDDFGEESEILNQTAEKAGEDHPRE